MQRHPEIRYFERPLQGIPRRSLSRPLYRQARTFEAGVKKPSAASRAIAEMRLLEIDPDLAKAGEMAKVGVLGLVPFALLAAVADAASRISINPETFMNLLKILQEPPFNQTVLVAPLAVVYLFREKIFHRAQTPLREREGRLQVDSRF